ncbi:MAG: hypothetical protein WBD31_07590 [Rubripirellula sp.]
MYDDRLKMIDDLGRLPIFPSLDSIWMMDRKYRMAYWLDRHEIASPETWIFYEESEAKKFVETTDYPIVFKMDAGSGASGVKILKSVSEAKGIIKRCFGSGMRHHRQFKQDREFGAILFQRFLPSCREWRLIKVGQSYFGFEKLLGEEFHSGSKQFSYGIPPAKALAQLATIAKLLKTEILSIDVFHTADGQFLVNEVQAQFGHQDSRELCMVDGKSGRLTHLLDQDEWQFEEGQFCKNYLGDLKIESILKFIVESRHLEGSN